MGTSAYCLAELGAKEVFGVDIIDTIEVAYKNTCDSGNITVARADIQKLPFKTGFFDSVVCVAVLHHLADREKTFNELLSHVKPGGSLVLWVYGKEGNAFVRYFVEPFRKYISTKMSIKLVLASSYIMGMIFQFIALFVYRPLNKIGINVLPLNDYISYRSNFNISINVHMIFDQLIAPVSYFYSRKELERLFSGNEISNFNIFPVNNNSWTIVGTKK